MPTNEEMRRTYQLQPSISTPRGRYINHVIAVGNDYIVLRSPSPLAKGPRTLRFNHIRNNASAHWQIIQSLRQVVGLSNEA